MNNIVSARRSIAMSAVLIAIAAAGTLSALADTIRITENLSSRVKCIRDPDFGTECDVVHSHAVRITGNMSWTAEDVDISTFDESTEVSLTIGDMSFGGALGDGRINLRRHTAVFILTDDETERTIGTATVKWSARGCTFVIAYRGDVLGESYAEDDGSGAAHRFTTTVDGSVSFAGFEKEFTGPLSVRTAHRTRHQRDGDDLDLATVALSGTMHDVDTTGQ